MCLTKQDKIREYTFANEEKEKLRIIEAMDFELAKRNSINTSPNSFNTGGLSFFEVLNFGHSLTCISIGSLRAFLSRNKGTVTKYINKDHCLDKEEMRDELTKKGVEVTELVTKTDRKYMVGSNTEVARGLGFFDLNKEKNIISNKASVKDLKVNLSYDFVVVLSRTIHKKISLSKITYLIFEAFMQGLLQRSNIEDMIKNMVMMIVAAAEIDNLAATCVKVYFFEEIVEKYMIKDLDYFENSLKYLKFSSLIEENEVSQNNLVTQFKVGKTKERKVKKNGSTCWDCCK